MTSERRTRFRDYMRRFDPTGDPAQAVAGGFYVPQPNAVSQRIATRIELQPASSHLLVGGIGSGKTTELIAIERRLAEVEDLLPVRIDVPSRHQLSKLKPGVLIALAATEACAELSREKERGLAVEAAIEREVQRVSTIARGYWAHDDYPERDDSYWNQGVLEAPEVSESVASLSDALIQIHRVLPRKLVILFDGLDRVADLSVLASVLAEDIPAIGGAGIGAVVIGPQHLRFSPQRFVESVFETVQLHGATAVDTTEGQTFLTAVLRARVDEALLPPASAAAIAQWSGGLLRDLVALARAAGADAYAAGADVVEPAHVNGAADRFGRALLFVCTKEMVDRLKGLNRNRPPPRLRGGVVSRENLAAFTVATEVDQRLLAERLVIEVPDVPVRYVLHPTIDPLIPGLGASW